MKEPEELVDGIHRENGVVIVVSGGKVLYVMSEAMFKKLQERSANRLNPSK